MTDSRVIMKGLADIRSRQIILTKFSENTKDFYPDSYVYAVANSVFPIFHEDKLFETDADIIRQTLPFYDTYNISETLVTELAEFLDEKWLSKEFITFYQLETHYQNRWEGKSLRSDLIRCLRYFYLDERFDESFWAKILAPMEYPTEASSITKHFKNSELQQH